MSLRNQKLPSRQALSPRAVWYLSHPVAPDDQFSYDDNMSHVLHIAKLCWDEGFRVYVPWHTLCLIMPDANPEYRRMGLEVDCDLAKMTGLMILSGHKISTGMAKELDAMMEREDAYWIDGTGLHDSKLVQLLRHNRRRIEQLQKLQLEGNSSP